MIQRLVFHAETPTEDIYIIHTGGGYNFIIICHEHKTCAYYWMNSEIANLLSISLGDPNQEFPDSNEGKKFIVEKEDPNGLRKFVIKLSNDEKDWWWMDMPKNKTKELIGILAR